MIRYRKGRLNAYILQSAVFPKLVTESTQTSPPRRKKRQVWRQPSVWQGSSDEQAASEQGSEAHRISLEIQVWGYAHPVTDLFGPLPVLSGALPKLQSQFVTD